MPLLFYFLCMNLFALGALVFHFRTCSDEGRQCVAEWLSTAWPSGSERRFYDGHDRKVDGLTPTQASLLHPGIRCFMAIFCAWEKFNKTQIEEVRSKIPAEKLETRQLLSESVTLDSSYS